MLRGGTTLPSSVTKLAMIEDCWFVRDYELLKEVFQGR
jgi:hypothetical protein